MCTVCISYFSFLLVVCSSGADVNFKCSVFFTAESFQFMVLCCVTSCRLARCRSVSKGVASRSKCPQRWRRHICPKRWHRLSRPAVHVVTLYLISQLGEGKLLQAFFTFLSWSRQCRESSPKQTIVFSFPALNTSF